MPRPAAQAVVFDLGKVLLDFDYGLVVKRIAQCTGRSLPELHQLINQSPLLLRYETGLLTTAQFFGEVQAGCGFPGDLLAFSEAFGDIFTPIPPMVEFQRELRQRGVPTYIFSNTNELAITDIRKRHPFFNQFDGYILSYEHRSMKPDPQLYAVVEKITGLSGPALAYIDDRRENIETAMARQWRSVLHVTPEATIAQIKRSLAW